MALRHRRRRRRDPVARVLEPGVASPPRRDAEPAAGPSLEALEARFQSTCHVVLAPPGGYGSRSMGEVRSDRRQPRLLPLYSVLDALLHSLRHTPA